eukprot:96241-Rhodomonas_salina.1
MSQDWYRTYPSVASTAQSGSGVLMCELMHAEPPQRWPIDGRACPTVIEPLLQCERQFVDCQTGHREQRSEYLGRLRRLPRCSLVLLGGTSFWQG